MNLNVRKLLRHIEYEPNTYYTAFSVELEAASSPLWSFINACIALVCLCYIYMYITLLKIFKVHSLRNITKILRCLLPDFTSKTKRERLNKLPGIFNVVSIKVSSK